MNYNCKIDAEASKPVHPDDLVKRMVLLPPDMELCLQAISEAQPRTQPRKFKLLLPNCDKCGSTGSVYTEPYAMSGKFVCEECDEHLFNFISSAIHHFNAIYGLKVWDGDLIFPTDIRYLTARAVVDAFFYSRKPESEE